jgi:hypothetical protein
MVKPKAGKATSKAAKQGQRMLEVKVRFWTNDLADGKGNVWPKHGWSSGVVSMERNETHGIGSADPIPFHSLLDLTHVIERVLMANEVVLHTSTQERHDLAAPPKDQERA